MKSVTETGRRVPKVLLVDDQPQNIKLLEATLDGLGLDLVKASSGREALEACTQNDFAAILLDVRMADMDGFETASHLRRRGRTRHTPIIFMTAYQETEGHAAKAYSVEAVNLVYKPIRPEILRSEVAALASLFEAREDLRRRAVELSDANAKLREQLREIERLNEALEVERHKLQVLVDRLPVGIFFASATAEVALVNKEAQRILGFAGRPEQGLSWYAQNLVFCRPDGTVYKPAELPLQRSLSRGETVVAEEIQFHFPDGRSLLVLVDATPFYSPDGAVTGVMAVIQDLTPLEESERLRNEFLGMVSHELKTPLAAIKGTAGMALGSQRYSQAPEVRELFEIVDEQADRLTGLVNNLLDMSRIEAGALSVSPEPADLSALLAEALEDFRRSYSHDVNLHIPEGLPPARADRRRVIQVVGNLLTNAAKFSPAAAPIEMDLEHDGAHIIVRVRDQGRGIPKEKLSLLFRKFSQVHQEDGGRLGGSGLGLAIAKGIVEAHGGRIWAESAGDGRGSTFCFTLPVAARWPATQVSKDAVRAEGRANVTHQGRRARVLAIDDDPHVLRLLRRCLGEAGYVPVMSNDPAQTIGLVECEVPDLVLLDLLLPGSSGFDLLRRIREFSDVPVIFLTASSLEEHTVRALKLGADDYITKPFSPSELLARIETALRRRVLPDRLEGRPPFVLEDLSVDYAERRVTRGEASVNLSPTEYKLLYELSVNAGRVLTHDQLLQRVWGPEYSGETEIVRSMVRNVRRRLGEDARHPRYILTEPQVGYRMPKA